jgi:membrane-bound serine protease (ClpP class)
VRRLAAALLVLAVVGGLHAAPAADEQGGTGAEAWIARIVVDGSINPAVADFIADSIERAHTEGARALVIQLDTPGGLMPSMKAIVKDMLAAPVPVIVYVAPSGAGAGSAGVFVTLAAHVAAMAPGTNIGAAHPVGGGGEDIKGTLGEKIENTAVSFIEAIARQRGRNVEWAAKAVRESVSITAQEAVKLKVVDFVARDLDEVMTKADGRQVEVAGAKVTLALGDAVRTADGVVRVHDYTMNLAQRVLNQFADPNIAYLLMMAGLLGLYVEFTHPGVFFPGVAGAICLLIALAALHVLPLNTSGLALLLLGIGLLIAEAFLPTAGVLGIGGLVAFVLGSLFLFKPESGVVVDRTLVFGVGGTAALVMFGLAILVFRSQRLGVTHGTKGMIGEKGEVRERIAPTGTVLVRGEYWKADSDDVMEVGDHVEVTAVDGLRLRVRRVPGRTERRQG